MRERENVTVATADHDAIIAALRTGDLPAAIEALRRNLQSGLEPIREWLKAREGDKQ